MTPAMFSPNGQTIVQFMSVFVPKLDFLAHFRVEQNFAYFLVFQESQILVGHILPSRNAVLDYVIRSPRHVLLVEEVETHMNVY